MSEYIELLFGILANKIFNFDLYRLATYTLKPKSERNSDLDSVIKPPHKF
jgi:hypothetical protein